MVSLLQWPGNTAPHLRCNLPSPHHYLALHLQYNPYRLVKTPFSLHSGCSSCWMPQNGHLYDTNIGVTAITPTGSTVKWTPAARRNAYLELHNFDAFVGTAGGCNALPDGKSAHQVFIRAEPQPLAAPPHCAAILDASPAAPSGVYSVHLDGSPEGSTQQVYCDMENGGYMHCGTGAAGASLSVELLRQENSDIVDRCVRTMLVGSHPQLPHIPAPLSLLSDDLTGARLALVAPACNTSPLVHMSHSPHLRKILLPALCKQWREAHTPVTTTTTTQHQRGS